MGKAPSKPVKTAKSSSVSRDLSGRTECTSVAASTRAPKQRKRRTNPDDFIDDYKLCIRDALIKLVRRAVPANKLGRRECCAVLWECFRKFQRDVTSLKLADARLMLNEAIANEKQKFDATAAFCLDTLDAAHLAQNRIAGIAARQKVPPSKSDTTDRQETHAKTTPIKTAKSPENTPMQDGKQSESTKRKATPYDKLANSCRKKVAWSFKKHIRTKHQSRQHSRKQIVQCRMISSVDR